MHETVKDALIVEYGSQEVCFERERNTELGLRHNRCDSGIDNDCVDDMGIAIDRFDFD